MKLNLNYRSFLFFIILLLNILNNIVNCDLTVDEIEEFRIDLCNLIDSHSNPFTPSSEKPLAATILRMVFHDCAGPKNDGTSERTVDNSIRLCDGCIEMDLADHGGLKELAIEPLAPLFQKYRNKMSIADFWVSCGNVVLEYTTTLSDKNGELPILPYFFGRPDCPLAPNAITRKGTSGTEFPLAHEGWDALAEFMENSFNMNDEEITAMVGAHTLGRAHETASGFTGHWTHDSFSFNNNFYIELIDRSNQWDQTSPMNNGFPQWENRNKDKIMLNADMSLILDFETNNDLDSRNGIAQCRAPGFTLSNTKICPPEVSAGIANDFANSNQLFLDVFASAYIKLVINNQNGLRRVTPNRFRDNRNNGQPVIVPAPTPQPVQSQINDPNPRPTDDHDHNHDGNGNGNGDGAPTTAMPSRMSRKEFRKDTRCCGGFTCYREVGHQQEPQYAYKSFINFERSECCSACQNDSKCKSWTWEKEYNGCYLYGELFDTYYGKTCDICVTGTYIARS